MDKTFSHDLRVLICPQCGGSVQTKPEGGIFQCSFCGVQMVLASRVEKPPEIVTEAPVDGEARRLEILRGQDGKPWLPPPSIRHLMRHGSLAPEKADEAVQEWQKARRELLAGPTPATAEMLHFLTMMLYQHYKRQKDDAKLRATVETASELLTDPRYVQDTRCMLARMAARGGDLKAAQEWLALCNPAPTDLFMDSTYRFTAAYLATRQGEWREVLRLLGDEIDAVPIADTYDASCGMMRANAVEKLRDVEKARRMIGQLKQIPHIGIRSLISVKEAYQLEKITLCDQSLPMEEAQVEMKKAASPSKLRWVFRIVTYLLILVGGGMLGVTFAPAGSLTFLPPFDPESTRIAGLVMLIIGGSLLFTRLLLRSILGNAADRERLMETGVSGKAEIVTATSTGWVVNDVMERWKFGLQVTIPNRAPYMVEKILLVKKDEIKHFQPGTTLAVKVDPKKPKKLALEI